MSPAPSAAGVGGTRCTCTACPLLCDDIPLADDGAVTDCATGRDAFAAALLEVTGTRPAGTAPSRAESSHDDAGAWREPLARAARAIASGRRTLLTGLADATVETVVAACDLAETVGAAVDPGDADLAAAAGPTIARAGRVTADWEELRDRADLVILWGCDPAASHPRFIERFVAPALVDGRERRTIAVGPAAVPSPSRHQRHLPLDASRLAEAARLLQFILGGSDTNAPTDDVLTDACAEIAAAIREATCVAIVTAAGDDVGLAAWSVVQLVRSIAHRAAAFEVPLAAAARGGAAAATVCTWRYGAAGGIDRADRSGGRFLPAEATATRLIARGEVDVVLAVGRLAGDIETAIAAAGPRLTVVRVAAGPGASGPGAADDRAIRLRCAAPLLTAGTLVRGDGRTATLVPPRASTLPSAHALILHLHEAVTAARAPDPGGRP